MDLQNLRKKNQILRPIARTLAPNNIISNNKDDEQRLKRTPSYQISIIPSGYYYSDERTSQSYEQSPKIEQEVDFETNILRKLQSPSRIHGKGLNPVQFVRNTSIIDDHIISKQGDSPFKALAGITDQNSDIKDEIQRSIKNIKKQKGFQSYSKQFLQKVQKILGYYSAKIVSDSLKKLLSRELMSDQAKIYICSECLTASLMIIKSINLQHSIKNKQNPFQIMNNMNKGILEYLMSKYPRSKNLFVEFQLESKFENISFITFQEYNMLVNCKYTFTERGASRMEILDRTKIFLNKILNQLDSKFLGFTSVLKQKIFNLSQSGGIDLKKNKIKIGRKIPENTEKFYQFQTQQMQIHSPQLFRVMIKWIESMQELLTNPSDMINKRSSLKYIKKNLGIGNIIFDQIQSKRFEEMKVQVIQKITSQTHWKKEINKLLQKLNVFNDNLTNTLKVRSPKTKFIRQEQAQTLKFAKCNTLFLQWLIVEKFLILIQTLSNLSVYFQTKYFKKLDFINFNVFDLMRGSFSGKKNQILQVFSNIIKLEESGQIFLLRIKNRLNTPLNDVLINFKLKDSFIICQLQLVLVQNLQEGQQKMKIMEYLNHVLYQLERSPYGALSQMALIVGYYDPTIIYEKKINFEKDWFTGEMCQNGGKHQFIQIQDQSTPFVCSWCVNFYGRQQNFFEYNQCINCSLQKCKACVFQEDPIEEKRVYYKYFASCFCKMPLQAIENDKDDDFIDNFFIREETNFISEKYIKLREYLHLGGKHSKLNALQNIMHTKQMEYGLKATEAFYCLLLRFEHGKHNLKVVKYENYKIQLCVEDKEIEKKFRIQRHDAIFLLRKRVYRNPPGSASTTFIGVANSSQKQSSNLKDITDGSKVKIRKKGYNVIYIFHNGQRYLLDWVKIANIHSDEDPEKVLRVLNTVVERCETYKAQRYCLQLENLGVSFDKLQPITSKKWIEVVKVLNLSKNQIKTLPQIFNSFTNLQELYLHQNLISSFTISAGQNTKLKVFDISLNQLQQITQQINNLKALIIFKAGYNQIKKFAVMNLEDLQELKLNNNKIQSLMNLADSSLPELQILNISKNNLHNQQKVDIKMLRKFTNLRKVEAKDINIKLEQNQKLELNFFKKLESLELSKNIIYNLDMLSEKHLREIRMMNCKLTNLKDVFTDKLIRLQIIQLQANSIDQFPRLDLPALLIIDFANNRIKHIENIAKSYLPKLQSLQLQSNSLKSIQELSKCQLPSLKKLFLNFNALSVVPIFNFPLLDIINLMNNKLVNIDNLALSTLPNLTRLMVRANLIEKLPLLKFDNLYEFDPCNNKISDIQQFKEAKMPKLSKITLWKNKLVALPKLNLPDVFELLLFENKLKDISGLTNSNLNSVKIISLYNNRISKLPELKLQNLEKLYAYKNELVDISELANWKTPKLQFIDLNTNKIQVVPKFSMQSLNDLQLSDNLIEDLYQFSQSELINLRKLFLNRNKKLKNICRLQGFKKIQQIQANYCSLENFEELAQCQLKNLKKLSLEYNLLKGIPRLMNFINLEEFLIRGNQITQLKYDYSAHKKLRRFWATNNLIEGLQSEIFEDSVVQEISLSKNPLKKIQIPETLKLRSLTINGCGIVSLAGFYAPKLSELIVKDNKLTDINFLNQPGSFLCLTKILLQKNQIKIIPSLDLPSLSEISLIENPIEYVEDLLHSTLPCLRRMIINKKGTSSQTLIKMTKSKQVKPDTQKIIQQQQSEDDFSEESENQYQNQNQTSIKKVPDQNVILMIQSHMDQWTKQNFIKKFGDLFPNTFIQI